MGYPSQARRQNLRAPGHDGSAGSAALVSKAVPPITRPHPNEDRARAMSLQARLVTVQMTALAGTLRRRGHFAMAPAGAPAYTSLTARAHGPPLRTSGPIGRWMGARRQPRLRRNRVGQVGRRRAHLLRRRRWAPAYASLTHEPTDHHCGRAVRLANGWGRVGSPAVSHAPGRRPSQRAVQIQLRLTSHP